MAAVTICSDFGAQKVKFDTVCTVSPSIFHEVMELDVIILAIWMLSLLEWDAIPFSLRCGVGSSHSIYHGEIKSRNIALPTKVSTVKAMVFPVVMCECERWTIKKAEHQRIDAFELWCWRRLLRVPWTARRSNQSILKEINPEYSLEGLMLKLKL